MTASESIIKDRFPLYCLILSPLFSFQCDSELPAARIGGTIRLSTNQLALRREEHDSPHVDVLGERKGRVAVDRDLWKPGTEACSPLCVWRGQGSKGKGRGGDRCVYDMLGMNRTRASCLPDQ